MADPTQNFVPKTALLKIIQDATNDKSIASAVKGTHASSTLYSDFDALRSNCQVNCISTTYGGTKGVTPTSSDDFRGYPVPTLYMNYAEYTVGSAPAAITEHLKCTPTLTYKVGFALSFNINVEHVDCNLSTTTVNHTLTFNAGSTTPATFTGATSLGGGAYKINTVSPTNGCTVLVTPLASSNNSYEIYHTDSLSWSTTLSYTPAQTVYTYLINHKQTGTVNCSSTPATAKSISMYGYCTQIANGCQVFGDSGLSTYPASAWYVRNVGGFGIFDYFYVNGSGYVSGYTVCT